MVDFIVVGGGPAGCLTAALLAEKGYEVHLFEEHRTIGEPVDCAGIIGTEAFQSLSLPGQVRLAEIGSVIFNSPTGLKINVSLPYPMAWIVDRAALDRALGERAAAAGVRFHLGCRVTEMTVREDSIEAVISESASSRFRSAKPYRRRAAMAILAGGPRYVLQGRLGMGRPRDFLKTAQVEIPARGLEETNIFVGARVAPGSFAWVVPFEKEGRKLARIGVSSKGSSLPYLRNLLERLRAEGRLEHSDFPIRSWVIPITPLRRTYARRVLAVGDAAGQVKPTTGGGIYFSLLCADSAAKIAALALDRAKFEDAFLAQYEKEWRSKLATEIGIGYFCRRLAERFTDHEMDQVFRALQSDRILASMQNRLRFDWHRELIWFALRHSIIGQAFRRKIFQCLMGAEPPKELVEAAKKHGLWFLRPQPGDEDSIPSRAHLD